MFGLLSLSCHGDDILKILPASDMETATLHHETPNSVIAGVNGTSHINPNIISSDFNPSSSKDRKLITTSPNLLYSKTQLSASRISEATRPPLSRMEDLRENSSGNSEDRFDSTDTSPFTENFTENFPDPLLPPPYVGESPLLRDESGGGSYDMATFGSTGYGGAEAYVGFDDLSSDAGSMKSGSGLMSQEGLAVTSSSSSHMLRRTPSYTSAIGSSMNADLTEESSPVRTGRVRQFDGKKYMVVDSSSSPT